ncbi:hypothetical protein TEA_019720 [Camellia sinensis var. sinensis]|uniref:Uncharacterized protein n=1 Tax=Camellia sinensis var. sinensis TaxID=542762 RepID=A0A4S4E3B2_CAMSN|nr:hypothetical protein TEA_019720 [Camellia sinensis var. sinensis]
MGCNWVGFIWPHRKWIKLGWTQALALPSQRRNLLQELFADIALKVDDRARDIILSREDLISPSEDGTEGPLCFYYVLADYFVCEPENGNPIIDLIVQLWSQSFVSHIFSLLFHKWDPDFNNLDTSASSGKKEWEEGKEGEEKGEDGEYPPFAMMESGRERKEKGVVAPQVQLDNSEVLLRYSSALVQDVVEDISLSSSHLDSVSSGGGCIGARAIKENPVAADKLESFLKQFPDFPTAFFVGGPADIFVIELTDQLQKLKVEPVLLHYLSQIKNLQGLELRMMTSTRLKTCLYSFTSPGGPMYPTRVVRHAAWDALDFLFPFVTSVVKRTCFHPIQWCAASTFPKEYE